MSLHLAFSLFIPFLKSATPLAISICCYFQQKKSLLLLSYSFKFIFKNPGSSCTGILVENFTLHNYTHMHTFIRSFVGTRSFIFNNCLAVRITQIFTLSTDYIWCRTFSHLWTELFVSRCNNVLIIFKIKWLSGRERERERVKDRQTHRERVQTMR